jgi:hypothetical protein
MLGQSTAKGMHGFGALPLGEHALGPAPSQAWLQGGFYLLTLGTAATIAVEGSRLAMVLGLVAGAVLRAWGPRQWQSPRAYRRDDRGVALCLPRRHWVRLEALTLAGYAPIYLWLRWREPSGRRGSALLWRGSLPEPLYRAFVRQHRRFPAISLF